MKRARATYLNGSKWVDMGPLRDVRWLLVCLAVAMFICGGCRT